MSLNIPSLKSKRQKNKKPPEGGSYGDDSLRQPSAPEMHFP